MTEKKYGSYKGAVFSANELRKVAPPPPPDDPPLSVGDYCEIVSGGPPCLVVDDLGEEITVALPDGSETDLNRAIMRRSR